MLSNNIFKILICSVCQSFPYSWLITRFVTTVTRRVPRAVQELCSHPEHLTSPSVSSEVRVAPFLVFYVMFCRSLFYVFSLYFVCHCVFRPSSMYDLNVSLILSNIFLTVFYVRYLLRENVNHGSFTLWWKLAFLSKQKGKEWPYNNLYHILDTFMMWQRA